MCILKETEGLIVNPTCWSINHIIGWHNFKPFFILDTCDLFICIPRLKVINYEFRGKYICKYKLAILGHNKNNALNGGHFLTCVNSTTVTILNKIYTQKCKYGVYNPKIALRNTSH